MTASALDVQKMIESAQAYQQGSGMPTAGPSLPVMVYTLEDTVKPANMMDEFIMAVYDKEFSLTNLKDEEIRWLWNGLQMAELTLRLSRPESAGETSEEIMLSVLSSKLYIKLCRSRQGPYNERVLENTQFTVKQASFVDGAQGGSRIPHIFGRGKKQ